MRLGGEERCLLASGELLALAFTGSVVPDDHEVFVCLAVLGMVNLLYFGRLDFPVHLVFSIVDRHTGNRLRATRCKRKMTELVTEPFENTLE